MPDYALGYSSSELERLRQQAKRLETVARRFLIDAGLSAGMRVLELGSGLGDVTKLIAEIVGPGGEIVSVERSPVMLAHARESEIANAQFVESDLATLRLDGERRFDALVGRLILCHLDDPAATMRQAVEYVRPGGLVAFQEADSTLGDHLVFVHREQLKLTYQVCEWIRLARGGTSMNPQMGLQLYQVFRQAGLPPPAIYFLTEVYGGACLRRIQSTVTIVRNLLPRLERLGISADEIGIATLEERLTAELEAADVVQALSSLASAYTYTRSIQ